VMRAADVKAALAKTVEAFGRLDFTFNNAGGHRAEEAGSDRGIRRGRVERFTGGTAEGRAKVIAEEPVGRMGKPEEIAAAVLWLCSDAAAFTVGHAMVVDGGQTIQ